MRGFAILVSSLLVSASAQASEDRVFMFNLPFLLDHCRGEVPQLPVFYKKSICKLYFDGWIYGYTYGKIQGQLIGALGKVPERGDLDSLSEEQRSLIFGEGSEKTRVCISAVEWDAIGELFSSYMKQHPDNAESKDWLMLQLTTQSFMMEEFRC